MFCIVSMTAFLPKLLTIRNKINVGIRNDKRCAAHSFGNFDLANLFANSSLANSNLFFTNITKNEDKKEAGLRYTFYKLVCNNENTKEVFIGYTITSMTEMFEHHDSIWNNEKRKEYNRRLYKIIRANGGFYNWTIKILEKCYFKDRKEALERKKEWIEKTPNDINMIRPIVAPKEKRQNGMHLERQRRYDNDHKLERKERRKANKDVINEVARERYAANKDKVNEIARKRYAANKIK